MTVVRLYLALDRDSAATFVELREKFTVFSIWTVIETTTALICANLPPMTTVLRRLYNKLISSVSITGASGIGSGSRSAGEKPRSILGNYIRSQRQKRFGSDQSLTREGAPAGLGWVYGAHSPAVSAGPEVAKGPLVTESSLSSSVPGKEQFRQYSRPLNSIGVETETYVDVEQAAVPRIVVGEVLRETDDIGGGSGHIWDNRTHNGADYLPPSARAAGNFTTTVTGHRNV